MHLPLVFIFCNLLDLQQALQLIFYVIFSHEHLQDHLPGLLLTGILGK